MVHVCVQGRSMDILVTVPSMDTGMWVKVDIIIMQCVPLTMNYILPDTSYALYILHIGTVVCSVQCM